MLWYKGWLETRFRLIFCCLFMLLVLAPMSVGAHAHGEKAQTAILTLFSMSNWMMVLFACAVLGGTGITTQPSFNGSNDVHGSTLFTISLPVSRLHLLAVRATLGWLEAAAVISVFCSAMWFVLRPLSVMATPSELAAHAAVLIGCGVAPYSLSVLLGTFLDEQWRTWGSMLGSSILAWVSFRKVLPPFADVFGAMGYRSPLITHRIPWSTVVFSVGVGAMLFFAALKIANSREY